MKPSNPSYPNITITVEMAEVAIKGLTQQLRARDLGDAHAVKVLLENAVKRATTPPEAPECIFSVGPQPNGRRFNHSCGNTYAHYEDVAVEGFAVFVQDHDEFWGEGKAYKGEMLKDPTWGQVRDEATKMIAATGDHHHVFLEAIHLVNSEGHPTDPDENVRFYNLSMGS